MCGCERHWDKGATCTCRCPEEGHGGKAPEPEGFKE